MGDWHWDVDDLCGLLLQGCKEVGELVVEPGGRGAWLSDSNVSPILVPKKYRNSREEQQGKGGGEISRQKQHFLGEMGRGGRSKPRPQRMLGMSTTAE